MSEEIPHSNTETETSLNIEVELFKSPDNTLLEKNNSLFKRITSKIDPWDKKLSNYIHELELNKILENIIYIFGRLFNSDMIIIFYISVFIYQSYFNKDYFFIIKPFIHVTVVFILTGILKYSLKRPRPEINQNVKRIYNLRKKEKNFSMPSGDSMQAGNFGVVALFYFNMSYLGFIILPFVMFARIFYFCHYFMDTLIGAIIGGGVSFGLVFPLRYLKF